MKILLLLSVALYQALPNSRDAALTIEAKCAGDWPDDFRMRQYCENSQHEALAALRASRVPEPATDPAPAPAPAPATEETYFFGIKMSDGVVSILAAKAGAVGTTLCEKAYQSHVVWVQSIGAKKSKKASFIRTCEAIVPIDIKACSSFSVAKEHNSTCLKAFEAWKTESLADVLTYMKLFFPEP